MVQQLRAGSQHLSGQPVAAGPAVRVLGPPADVLGQPQDARGLDVGRAQHGGRHLADHRADEAGRGERGGPRRERPVGGAREDHVPVAPRLRAHPFDERPAVRALVMVGSPASLRAVATPHVLDDVDEAVAGPSEAVRQQRRSAVGGTGDDHGGGQPVVEVHVGGQRDPVRRGYELVGVGPTRPGAGPAHSAASPTRPRVGVGVAAAHGYAGLTARTGRGSTRWRLIANVVASTTS